MIKTTKIGSHKTTVIPTNHKLHNGIKINYHHTTVVQFNDKVIILKNNGWFTLTTKKRMNQASIEFGLKFNVFQKNKKWYVNYNNKIIEFYEGIELLRN